MSKDAWQNLGLAALTAVTVAGVVWLFTSWPPTPPPSNAAQVQFRPQTTAAPRPEAAAPQPVIDLPRNPRLWIIGDSWTEGGGASRPENGYAYVTSDLLGWDTRIDGVGGSGYSPFGPAGPQNQYRLRIKEMLAGGWDPDVVLMQGGLNDYAASEEQMRRYVQQDVALLRDALPGVEIVGFGPLASAENIAGGTVNLDDRVEQAMDAADVPYISPIDEGWITGRNSDRYIDDSGFHPNDAGHAYVARRLVADLQALAQ